MRVKLGCCFIAFIAAFYSFSYAQTRPSGIYGSVFLQNKIAAEAATVVLLNQTDSTVVASALVNNKGTFSFNNIAPGKYLILATRLGYQRSFYDDINLALGQILTLAPIILSAANTELKGVTIVAKTPFVETRPGKVIINPQASITADGKSALDILKQSPGVKVDNGDNISITGKQPALILLDGKTTNLTGTDLATLLKNIQGTTIDRFEVIRSGSARYDASAGGVINIILKKGKNIGTNGTYTASIGYGRYYKANTGILFNSRSKGLNIFGNYNIESRKSFRDISTDRNIVNTGVTSNFNSAYQSVQQVTSHTFKAGADFYLNPNHIIGVVANGSVSNIDIDKHTALNIRNQGNLDSVIRASSTIERRLNNVNYNLNYTGRLDTTGKNIAASITYTPINRHNDEYIGNNFFNAAGVPYRNPLLLQNLSPSHRSNWTALLDYSNPISKKGAIDAGVKYSSTKSDNNFAFGPLVNGVYTSNPNFSNRFNFNEKVGAGYVNYKNSFGKYDLEAGLRGEYTKSDGVPANSGNVVSRKYFNLFPSLLINYRYNDKNQFNITFSRGISRPEYEKLNPFYTFLDLYSYQAGNPYLKPSYSSNLSVGHIYNDRLSSSIYASVNEGIILPFFTQNNANKVNILGFRNLGTSKSIGATLSLPVKMTDWWSSSYDINASYTRYKAYTQNGDLNQGTGDLQVNGTQSFTLNKFLTAELSGNYESPNAYGVNQFKAQYTVNGGIKAQILNKRGAIGLNVADIFNTYRDRYYTYYQGLDLRQTDKSETRVFRLNFSYRFGKASVGAAANHKTGNELEQLRMK